jgi:hypothetical protein
MTSNRGSLLLLLTLLLFPVGCGGPSDGRLVVTGEVSFDGQPVALGSISLIPLGKGPSVGGEIIDGQFRIAEKGPTAGEYRVMIQGMRETGRMVAVDRAFPEQKEAEMEQYIPTRYNSRSELKVSISPDNTHLVLELSSTPS